jgi:CubicO group peptidase (beta-lactamase class C family)
VVLALGATLSIPDPAAAEDGSSASTQVPISTGSAESLIADLSAYIPGRMESGDVPGLAIALVHEGQIVWEAGFGVASTLSGAPVTEDSVFEAASLSKPVAAYAALRLVDSGALGLDEPLHTYFSSPWLPRSERSDLITLRQLLAHTSGLSSRLYPLDKSIAFEPGERFSYSNVGYQYVQAAIEQVSASSLEEVARQRVLEPLGMDSSTFADRPDLADRSVSGHVNYGTDLAPVFAVAALSFTVILVLGAGSQRIRKGRIAVRWRHLAAFNLAALAVSVPVIAWLSGGFTKWSGYFALVLGAMSIWLWLWFWAAVKVYARLPAVWKTRRRRIALGSASMLCGLIVFAVLANAFSGPVPRGPSSTPGAAYSLKSTAGDLARFMIELGGREHENPETAAEMTTPQCATSATNSWGLGIAVYHAPDGDWLWHSGDNQDFHALMVMHPDSGRGVVVLTNGQAAPPVIVDVARRAMGVDFVWSSR